jgi:hypothetical protein
MLNQIPDRMELNLGGRVSAEKSFGACNLGYTVGATLDECNGMNSIRMTTREGVVGQNQAGEVIATVPMVISAGPVNCSGHACARGEACGANLRAAASVTPSLSISNATVEVAMKVVSGSGANNGKQCFQAVGVAISGAIFDWGNLKVNFNGLAFDIPSSALQQVWTNMQLPQVEEIFYTQLSDLLQKQMSAIDTCFDVAMVETAAYYAYGVVYNTSPKLASYGTGDVSMSVDP